MREVRISLVLHNRDAENVVVRLRIIVANASLHIQFSQEEPVEISLSYIKHYEEESE